MMRKLAIGTMLLVLSVHGGESVSISAVSTVRWTPIAPIARWSQLRQIPPRRCKSLSLLHRSRQHRSGC